MVNDGYETMPFQRYFVMKTHIRSNQRNLVKGIPSEKLAMPELYPPNDLLMKHNHLKLIIATLKKQNIKEM